MSNDTWKYVENAFDNVTKNSKKRMKEIGIHHRDAVTGSNLSIAGALVTRINTALPAYLTSYGSWVTNRAQLKGATQALEAAVAHLTSTDIEDIEVAYKAAYKRTTNQYATAFPHGREPFQTGGVDDRVTALETLAQRLGVQQSALAVEVSTAQSNNDPNLPQLEIQLDNLSTAKTLTDNVLTNLTGLRTTQNGLEAQVDLVRLSIEPLRVTLAAALYANCGQLMSHFSATPESITPFFDLTKLRETSDEEEEPEPPPPVNP